MIPILLAAMQAQPAQQYTAQLGKPYLLGPVATVSGSKETLDLGIRRWVTLKSVRTDLVFGGKKRTFVAGPGKMLVIFEATIKNPAKLPIGVHDSETFGLRVYESGLKPGDIKYLGAADRTMGLADAKLQLGESADVFTVYEFPASIKNLRVGIYFDTYLKTTPKFDLTSLVKKSNSIFAIDSLSFRNQVQTKRGVVFDLDELEFKVKDVTTTADGGVAVQVEVRNPLLFPARWGWQYAKATLIDKSGKETAYYPDFFVASGFESWANEVKPGQAVSGEYRFYPTSKGALRSFVLAVNATGRSVVVNLD